MVQDAERAMKAIMIQFRIPLQFWDYALRSALGSRNLFSLSKNMKSKDGDAPCPWNEATGHVVSRGMTLRALGRFVTCGTFAASGNSKILASNIETPIRKSLGINLGMIGICESDLAFWLDIHTNVIVRTNDFKEIDLGIGTSAYQYFGLASPPLPKRALPIPDDFRPQVREVIKLRGVGMADSNGMTHERITLRDLGQLPHERAVTIDENGNVVICGRDGIWVKTGEKLSSRPADVLQESLRVPDLVQQNNLRNMQEQLDLDPHSLINTSVYRRFTPDGMGYKTGADDGSHL